MKKIICLIAFFFATTCLISCGSGSNSSSSTSNSSEEKKYDTYEEACDDGDFQSAHAILLDMKKKLRKAIKEAQEFEMNNELVKEVGEKRHLFKENETIYDDSNRKKYEGMIEKCKRVAEDYLNGVIFVYDEEIRTVENLDLDPEEKSSKIDVLKGQKETDLKFFQNLYLKDTWNSNSFEKIIEKVNGLLGINTDEDNYGE